MPNGRVVCFVNYEGKVRLNHRGYKSWFGIAHEDRLDDGTWKYLNWGVMTKGEKWGIIEKGTHEEFIQHLVAEGKLTPRDCDCGPGLAEMKWMNKKTTRHIKSFKNLYYKQMNAVSEAVVEQYQCKKCQKRNRLEKRKMRDDAGAEVNELLQNKAQNYMNTEKAHKKTLKMAKTKIVKDMAQGAFGGEDFADNIATYKEAHKFNKNELKIQESECNYTNKIKKAKKLVKTGAMTIGML